ncbi:MAG: arginine decarboxylase [Actinomycetota bacterium]|jgi:arginine decarboxylase|nr:arginine decarboxylase [Actinomycetota bacterium]MDQ1669516.1 arginine decarboxylase [Actinomycetota bacterium]
MTEEPSDFANDAPLLQAWARFQAESSTPFTIPGHHRRAGQLSDELGRLLQGDVPLFGGLADIKRADGALAAAERLGARLWGADWCRYSTGGSTHANQVVALAVGRPGDTVLVSRAAHRSTLSGLVLAGLRPVWLPAEIDQRFGIPTGLSAATVERALSENPGAAALFCVEPGYLGTLSDLPAIIALAQQRDVPVVVDQAWGAHFGFHPAYPPHALALGADAMVLSAHKTLPAYSQASVIAASTRRLDVDRLDRAFEASATTSPAGVVHASTDAARALLASPLAHELLDRLAHVTGQARQRLQVEVPGLRTPTPEDFAPGRYDPAKLVLQLDGCGIDGNELERALIDAGMPVELADRDTVVPIVTMLDDDVTVSALVDRVVDAAAHLSRTPRPRTVFASWAQGIPEAALTPREAFFARHETVDAGRAIGRVSAELVAPYPPGVPVLVPGEVISEETLSLLRAAADGGTRIAYAADPSMATVQVVA